MSFGLNIRVSGGIFNNVQVGAASNRVGLIVFGFKSSKDITINVTNTP